MKSCFVNQFLKLIKYYDKKIINLRESFENFRKEVDIIFYLSGREQIRGRL